MDLIKVCDKYREKMKFFECKDILNLNHIKVFVKGLNGMKTFLIENNDMFEPIAIEWLDCYYECQHKFDEKLFYASVFYSSSSIIKILLMEHTSTSFINDFAYRYFEILYHVPGHVLAQIFTYQLSVFKMLAIKIFDCDAYSNQVTLLEILFRFVNEYRNYQFNEDQLSTQDILSTELFPDINNKNELIELFLNMKKSSFDIGSRLFLNKLNCYVKPCKIFSIIAESIKFNGNNLIPPILSNQSYQFWIDFNISLLQISFPCKGVENENDWVSNLIIKEDLESLMFKRNDTHLNVFIYLKRISNFSIYMPKLDSNFIKINFSFIINHNTGYLEKNVLPYYQSYTNLNNTSQLELTPIIQQSKKHKRCQKILTPETIERINKYDTIVEEQEIEGQQLHAKIIKYANNTVTSFTFDQSFSKSSNSFNFNIFKDSALKPVLQEQAPQVEPARTVIKPPVLSNLSNHVANKRTTKIVKGCKRKKNTDNVVKNIKLPNNTTRKENPDFNHLKSNDKPNINKKRKLYTKQVTEEAIGECSQNLEGNNKQRKSAKPKKNNKLINRVVPLQTDIAKKRKNIRSSDYSNSEVLKIQANVEIINSGIQNYDEIMESEIVDKNIQVTEKKSPSVYDIRNIQRVETRDEDFLSNIISQVRSQKDPSKIVQQMPNLVSTNTCELLPAHTSTPLASIQKTVNNKNVSNSYRRFAKSKDITKLGYNSNIDSIDTFMEDNLNKSSEQPVRVQGFRESKAKIKNFCEISSSMDDDEISETTGLIENIVLAEVHLPNDNENSFMDNLHRVSNDVSLSNDLTSKTHIGINKTINTSISKQVENGADKLQQTPILLPIEQKTAIIAVNEISKIPITKQTGSRSGEFEQITSFLTPIGQNTTPGVNEISYIPINNKEIIKSQEKRKSISIPMPILVDEIKTEYIISVDDDSDCENINWDPESLAQVNSRETNVYSSILQQKGLETESEGEVSFDINEGLNLKPVNKQTSLRNKFKQIKNNTIINSIKNAIMERSSKVLFDSNRRLSPHSEIIKYRYPSTCGQWSKNKRHTINVDTNIAQNYNSPNQLQILIDMFVHTLENETNMNEIQTALDNIKKVRLEKEKSLQLIVDEKNLQLCNKQAQIIHLLDTIKEEEEKLKISYKNLFKKMEKLTKCINNIRAEVCQGENEISQIRNKESNLSKQLMKTISDHGENVRNEIWKQYVVNFGTDIKQHFLNRYL